MIASKEMDSMKIDFHHAGATCFVPRIDGRFKIASDPCLGPEGTIYSFELFTSTRVKPPLFDGSVFDGVRIRLVTHDHADHIDDIGVSEIDEESIVITRREAVTMLSNEKLSNLRVMDWNESMTYDIEDYMISVRAIPAFHGNNPMTRMLAGKVNGCLVTISRGGETTVIYLTSDTVYHEKVMKSLANEKIDILIANLGEVRKNMNGGPLTMSVPMLRNMVSDLNPGEVIPGFFLFQNISGFLQYLEFHILASLVSEIARIAAKRQLPVQTARIMLFFPCCRIGQRSLHRIETHEKIAVPRFGIERKVADHFTGNSGAKFSIAPIAEVNNSFSIACQSISRTGSNFLICSLLRHDVRWFSQRIRITFGEYFYSSMFYRYVSENLSTRLYRARKACSFRIPLYSHSSVFLNYSETSTSYLHPGKEAAHC
jgi:L-ascorbate metabolism protein UlaG (beta-lactamase superfamily)